MTNSVTKEALSVDKMTNYALIFLYKGFVVVIFCQPQ